MQPETIPIRTPTLPPASAAKSSIPEKLITQRQTAEDLSVSERTVYTLVRDGTLKVVRIGRAIRFAPEDLRDAISKLKS
jgi:excisionase family DNA binding protein